MRRVYCYLEGCRTSAELWVFAEIAETHVAFARGKQKHIRTFRVEIDVSNNLRQLFNALRFEVHQVESHKRVLEIPKMDAKIIWRYEVFAIRARAERVDVVVVTVFKLFALDTFETRTDDLILREYKLPVHNLCFLDLFALLVLEPPKLDDPVVRC